MIEIFLGGILGILLVHTYMQHSFLIEVKFLLQDIKKIQLRTEYRDRTQAELTKGEPK